MNLELENVNNYSWIKITLRFKVMEFELKNCLILYFQSSNHLELQNNSTSHCSL
jgi:hypothetical protein